MSRFVNDAVATGFPLLDAGNTSFSVADPVVAGIALSVQPERLQVTEASGARDACGELKILRRSWAILSSNPSAPQVALPLLSLEGEAEKTIATRHSIFAALLLPSDIPEDELQPILLPHSRSLGDFVRNTTGVRAMFSVLVPSKIFKNL
ncbi:hypothetical protein M404DRAFT_35956 [Pisolithus tinctorius Marx 270]|uniref:Uncharacterized protein n=1 Tax=Pisolithus tinctorius Marx 270 TaxID=870435 RepID=A0A0C3NCL9_PISTI|nr:hypothetical protein M404DRAFT_35956 [Pisolithus tinctorius Marx 270]